jgi:hypothetical protein
VGATLVTGSVWPAVSQLLTWGYCRRYPDLAWRSLKRNTLASRAEAFPGVWFNIWSGPDGIDAATGRTWASPVTPVTDFPIMNANLHAMALFALVRVCGIAPTADGLLIRPQIPRERFALDTPLLSLEYEPGRLHGVYHACVTGTRRLRIEQPAGTTWTSARIGDHALPELEPTAPQLDLDLSFNAGDDIAFEVAWW